MEIFNFVFCHLQRVYSILLHLGRVFFLGHFLVILKLKYGNETFLQAKVFPGTHSQNSDSFLYF